MRDICNTDKVLKFYSNQKNIFLEKDSLVTLFGLNTPHGSLKVNEVAFPCHPRVRAHAVESDMLNSISSHLKRIQVKKQKLMGILESLWDSF